MRRVGIVLVNYADYARKYLEEFCEGLRRQTYPLECIRVFIVDNASTDESRDFISRTCPEATVIPRSDGNYSAANNAGIRAAIAAECGLVTMVNMDTRVDDAWLEELVRALEADEGIAIAQSRVLLYPSTEEEWKVPRINTVGNHYHFLGFGFPGGYLERDRPIEGDREIPGYASGCSLAARCDVLTAMGLYDEDLYMYHDDIDISLKARMMGYRLVLASRSRLYHKYEFERSQKMLYFMERNRYLTMFHFYSWPLLLAVLPAIVAMDLAMLAYSVFGGWLGTKIAVYRYLLSVESWRKICSRRKHIRALKKITDRQFMECMESEMTYPEIDNAFLRVVVNPMMRIYWACARGGLMCCGAGK